MHQPVLGNAVVTMFLIAQLLDGVFTYVGVRVFGPEVEANPIIAWHIAMVGAGAAVLIAKTVAVLCAAVLHLSERHLTLAALTFLYLTAAVWPWARVLILQ